MENNMKNNPDFLAMVDVMKDNAHCPAHRNCDKCVYAEDNTMCALMIKAAKLIDAGFTKNQHDFGDIVYMIMPWIPTVKKMLITDIHYDKNNKQSTKWFQCREYRTGIVYTFRPDDFNKTVFASKQDAENVIQSWRDNGLR